MTAGRSPLSTQQSEGPSYVYGLDCGHEKWISATPSPPLRRCATCGEWRGVIVLLVPGTADPKDAISVE